MKRMLMLLTIAVLMAAMMATSALPALAGEKSCDEVLAKTEEALAKKDIDPNELVALITENPECFTQADIIAVVQAIDNLILDDGAEEYIQAVLVAAESAGVITPEEYEDIWAGREEVYE